jgi:hypothetical protein
MASYYDRYHGIQTIPLDAIMPSTAQMVAELTTGGLVLGAVIWGLRNIVVRKDPQLLILMIVGLLAVSMEVHVIEVWRFFYPIVGQHTLYSGLGPQAIPLFTAFVYSIYFGFSSYLYLINTDGHWSTPVFVKSLIAITFCEALMEITFIHFGLWAYFDDQPFTLFGFPIHVAFTAACFTLLYAEIMRAWFASVTGPGRYLMILFGPMIIHGLFIAYCYPLYVAFESDGGLPAAQAGSIVSMALSITATVVGLRLFARLKGNITGPIA